MNFTLFKDDIIFLDFEKTTYYNILNHNKFPDFPLNIPPNTYEDNGNGDQFGNPVFKYIFPFHTLDFPRVPIARK